MEISNVSGSDTALASTPVVLVSEPLVEVLAAVLVLLTSLVLQCWIKSWRTQAANLADAAVTF